MSWFRTKWKEPFRWLKRLNDAAAGFIQDGAHVNIRDGKQLATASRDGTVQIYAMQIDELLKLGRS